MQSLNNKIESIARVILVGALFTWLSDGMANHQPPAVQDGIQPQSMPAVSLVTR